MTQDITERTFEFAVRVVKLCQVLEKQPGVTQTLAKQLLRSGTSIAANVEEARAGQSKADFIHKNAIALKEARETHYWLRLLIATEIISSNKLNELLQESEELKRILGAIIVKSKR
ncbi:four helix bundle protein [Anabaena cylindrica FACHB-243]|uniref:CHP02436-containing protein n=1 Tax=Anabaena cylindrica (strain ATCC 27899 / PCC 7122) TaxID=272123 RepID=K9ZPA0_ANACC|nr:MULTISPECIES: four helix bundle protein [Anabaena]AFZ61063.1 CHP02436-containing protein [Anabaena cylindrica PCC 7122]MBD2421808.1 four helix bundle protein [Anabaena cylindrica FACHB-243]MBY5284592.1 four helix bundle protein [Anabaena sp. CCAP 1446/1C]MBY5306421.1 four helix bundle protein [Anabaena sp. CCAP 1446/1C]MCM2408065.1 four helix bundle protein [Anabaena sp. CCAP 1446/1C]